MARKRTIIISILGLLLLAGIGVGGYVWHKAWLENQFLTVPPESPGRDILFRVEPGEIFTTISSNLKKNGLITDTRRFLKLAQRTGKTASLRAGQFKLSTGWTPSQILHELSTSAGIMKKASIREGLTWWQTADKIQSAQLGSFENFSKAVTDLELLQKFGIEAKSAEGYLFPETYLLTPPKGDQSRYMVELMLKEFFRNAPKAWPDGLPEFKEMHKMVTLASLIEKETGNTSERKRISGVFHNRLKKRMLIQADPTIIYGLGPTFDGDIRRSHILDKTNPYNTYVIRGLPPGPICSPGLDALMAAIHPEKHNFFYFVAKGDGSHYFSKTLSEHNKAVRDYQLRRNRETYRSTQK
nr:endolytic transglycosylase MltG [uncultured Pseudodesulfovibrio sp.]